MIVHAGSRSAFALVGVGGAVGGSLRYGLVQWFPETTGGFPVTTFLINVLGSFALAVLVSGVAARSTAPGWLRPALGTGLLGGFTTFSAVMRALDALDGSGHPSVAIGYLVATLAFAIGAAVLGVNLGEWWVRRDAFRETAGVTGVTGDPGDPRGAAR